MKNGPEFPKFYGMGAQCIYFDKKLATCRRLPKDVAFGNTCPLVKTGPSFQESIGGRDDCPRIVLG